MSWRQVKNKMETEEKDSGHKAERKSTLGDEVELESKQRHGSK